MIAIPPPFVCQIEHTRDGDTFVCASGQVVRLARIDAPDRERNAPCRQHRLGYVCDDRLAAASKLALIRIVADRPLRCVPVPYRDGARTAYDRYGRVVARCYLGQVDVGEAMVRGGYAQRWPR